MAGDGLYFLLVAVSAFFTLAIFLVILVFAVKSIAARPIRIPSRSKAR